MALAERRIREKGLTPAGKAEDDNTRDGKAEGEDEKLL
jgi:hypothetical protein